jgi:hypothetical protein
MRARIMIAAALLAAVACRQAPETDSNPQRATTLVDGSMAGIVTDQATGRGIFSAIVTLMPNPDKVSSAQSVSGATNDQGRFQIDRVVAGDYIVEASARGYKARRITLRFAPGQDRDNMIFRLTTESTCPKGIAVPRVGVVCP